jgi:hypothetical protein
VCRSGNVYPILASVRTPTLTLIGILTCIPSQAEAKATRLLLIIIVALHAGLAITFKVLFFSYYIVAAPGSDPNAPVSTPSPSSSAPAGAGNKTTVSEVMRRMCSRERQ